VDGAPSYTVKVNEGSGVAVSGEKRGKVLLVDDDVYLVRSASIYLEKAGYDVSGAFSGEEGLKMALDDPPDVIVLDIDMSPGMSGPEAMRKIRADERIAGVPIVFLTAKVDLDAMEAALDDVAQGYLLKPLSGGDLLDKIEEVLSGR